MRPQRLPWPFALRRVRRVCERCASRHGRARLEGDRREVGEEAPEVREVLEVPVVAAA